MCEKAKHCPQARVQAEKPYIWGDTVQFVYILTYLGEQGWLSGERAHLPPMWPGFDSTAWGLFLETPDNFPGPKTSLGAQYSWIAIHCLLSLKAKF